MTDVLLGVIALTVVHLNVWGYVFAKEAFRQWRVRAQERIAESISVREHIYGMTDVDEEDI